MPAGPVRAEFPASLPAHRWLLNADHFSARLIMTHLFPVRIAAALALSGSLLIASGFAQNSPGPKSATATNKSVQAEVKPKKERKGTKWDLMDVGPFFSSGLAGKHQTLKALTIKLGTNATMCFDTELLRMSAGWTGGFLLLPTGRDGLEGVPEPVGTTTFSTPRGPGWAKGGSFEDPRPSAPEDSKPKPCGPMPRDWAHWQGLYQHGGRVVLSYSVGNARVLEVPGFVEQEGLGIFTRDFEISAGATELDLLVHEEPNATANIRGNVVAIAKPSAEGSTATTVWAAEILGGPKATWALTPSGGLHVKLAEPQSVKRFQIAIWRGATTDFRKFTEGAKGLQFPESPGSWTKGGPSLWGAPLVTAGKLGSNNAPYTVDTLVLPDENPWKSWLRLSGFDFFKNATRAAVCSVSGDVWLVDGIDDKLENLRWKRFATGLFQPLGLKIVDDTIYVTGRDQITRLHDLNGDDEADFYENFNNDIAITSYYHEFAMNLETDSKGNFYFTKGGNLDEARTPHHGTLLRVTKDGRNLEVVCTGLRAPNGLGMGPHDEITTADNEGNWVPSSRVDLCTPGRFNGHVFNSHSTPKPTTFDPPLFWLPHSYELDNSSGGQVWVTSDKWGPFRGDMLHTSYGACSLFHVMQEKVDGVAQAGCVKFPLKFNTGIMRGRFNPRDGQLYLAGLVVWQSNGPRQGGFQRVRYTGQAVQAPQQMHVRKNGIEITFANALDKTSATDLQNYTIEQWNYKWTSNYGSPEFSVAEPNKKSHDKVAIRSVTLAPDRKTVLLEIPDLQPVMQMRIKCNLKTDDGAPVAAEIFNTINKVPAA